MSFARRRRPGLLGTVARTAVITGTASATANAVGRRSHERAVDQQQAAAFRSQQQAAAAPPPPPGPPAGPDLVVQLGELARLRDTGMLTAEEFDTAKAALLRR
ncbi:MAG TPA: SHOCT domain-containing protein [Mycobacteriales bacterium]